MVRLVAKLKMDDPVVPTPVLSLLFQTMQFVMVPDPRKVYKPPPIDCAMLPDMVQLIRDGEELPLNIAPPRLLAALPENRQFIRVGEALELDNPPPSGARFPEKVQLLMMGDPELFSIPPPLSEAFPPVIVKPSITAVLFVAEAVVTW